MRKDKRVAVSSSSPPLSRYHHDDDDDDDEQYSFDRSDIPSFPAVKFSSRNNSSKYDFVKVKVWLGDNDHYYVLSRFLLSRMLTVTKIPNHVAIKITLELKKLLVDNSLLDVSQSDLEANLFKLMERRGFGEEYINRYKMMTRFHHQRVPLVILVCGTACSGKSTIATQLAQRLNLPNVLQTDMVYELLRTSTDAPLASTPVWARDYSSSEELITEFCRECRVVRKGLAGDLKKAMKDGKPIIIEGIHLDPSIYLMDEENKLRANLPEKSETNPMPVISDENPAEKMENNSTSVNGNHAEISNCTPAHVSSEEWKSGDQVNKASDSQESIDTAGSDSTKPVENVKDPETERNASIRKEKSGADPIIIPIVLKMAEFDHKALLEEWISTRTYSNLSPVQQKECENSSIINAAVVAFGSFTMDVEIGLHGYQIADTDRLISNFKTIQDYLCSFESQGLTVVNISANTFPQTLDWLHGYLLQCIEQGISSESNENGRKPAEN